MNLLGKIILLLLLIPIFLVLMPFFWLFGGKFKIIDKKTKLPIGYVKWFTFHSYY